MLSLNYKSWSCLLPSDFMSGSRSLFVFAGKKCQKLLTQIIVASEELQFYSTYTQASRYHVRTCPISNSGSSSGRYCTTLPSCFVLFWFYHLHGTKTQLRKREERQASEDKPMTPTTASALLTNLYMLLISWLAARSLTWSSFSVGQPGAKRSLVLGHQRFHFKPEALSCPCLQESLMYFLIFVCFFQRQWEAGLYRLPPPFLFHPPQLPPNITTIFIPLTTVPRG